MKKLLGLAFFVFVAMIAISPKVFAADSAVAEKHKEISCRSTAGVFESILLDLGSGKTPEQIVMFHSAKTSKMFREDRTTPFDANDRQWFEGLVSLAKQGGLPEDARKNCMREGNLLNPRDRAVLNYYNQQNKP